MEEERWVITVIGLDRVGIVAGTTAVLAERNANILDIRQTLMEEFFTMLMLVDISNIEGGLKGCRRRWRRKATNWGSG